ncbi:hypothetical protein D3Y59_12640 [Hymenobacter oligotrophus]|uniref:Uncharacterized protein n=1 Tax=Hymenobacter oligotrophus TaxID=2319843 RepID=A0A3B7REY1_9BACT|nr:hypothetical protein D3Y59_12640 [Hymenobacter oligotrophus]
MLPKHISGFASTEMNEQNFLFKYQNFADCGSRFALVAPVWLALHVRQQDEAACRVGLISSL